MYSECLICERIEHIKKGINPSFVAETESGYIVLGDHQFFHGYTLLLSKKHVSELHELSEEERRVFLYDMSATAAAVHTAFHPKKINYELLGNTHAHMHWHIFPRYEDGPEPERPVWVIPNEIRSAPSTRPDTETRALLKSKLLAALKQTSPGMIRG